MGLSRSNGDMSCGNRPVNVLKTVRKGRCLDAGKYKVKLCRRTMQIQQVEEEEIRPGSASTVCQLQTETIVIGNTKMTWIGLRMLFAQTSGMVKLQS
jgi:hypothetical protein